ncbi:glucose-1-phosphate cytidylyltransferase [Bacillus sp. M6-12]|uniref:glucose-1-phosphate cytidylyltransferase n=1 Tax=Bacillus sp. M6-12 TaxID=2054166 RepID=UPI000C779DD0|nr:glucose-1-phosphate cytidylyltransferase [Bacillus sp. M6-12]PLS16195.1 glucose-1-phosphate cytidylyltransferase [Bacillus sp. M6-12]
MKVVILAGGLGTRIMEESHNKPKPMITIGDMPILWHVMKIYSRFGFNEFIICLGYKSQVVKEFFANYFMRNSDITFDFQNGNQYIIHHHFIEPWKVTLAETGLQAMTGARIKNIQKYIGNESFMLTYGDGLGDINIKELLEFHKTHGKAATVTATKPIGRFGILSLTDDNKVERFQEKKQEDDQWISAGFFILEPEVFQYLNSREDTVFEQEPLENLAKNGQLIAFKHSGFWHPMDTLRDKEYLEELWDSGHAPWKTWN